MQFNKNLLRITVPILLCILGLMFDTSLPLGVAVGIIYTPLIFCAAWFSRPQVAYGFAAIGTGLIIYGYFASAQADIHVLSNRSLAIGALWVIAASFYFRKKAESKLQDALRELEITNQSTQLKYKNILDNAADAIINIDINGIIASFNTKAEEMFGYQAKEVIGKNVKILMPKPYSTEHDGYISNFISTGEKKIIGTRRELVASKKDGTQFPIELSVSASQALSSDNSGLTFTGIVSDISARKKLEEQIKKQNNELKISNKELEQFAYVASHDLQEPLRTVSSYVDLLNRKLESDNLSVESRDKYTYFIVDATARMKNLISDLLSFSRVGKKDNFKAVDSNQIIQNVLKNLDNSIQSNNVQINYPQFPELKCVESEISQLFQNILSNAIKFKAKKPPQIDIQIEDRGHEWFFSFQDNGIGMAEKYFEKVFIIFQRLHGKQDYAGTGIGLAMCKKIVEGHGGKIWIESELGKGTNIKFTISKNPIQRTNKNTSEEIIALN